MIFVTQFFLFYFTHFTAFGGPGFGVELDLGFAEDITLRKNGVMKIIATYTEPLPPTPHPRLPFTIPPLPTLSPSKAYGLIWRVSRLNEQGKVLQTQYIPQVCTFYAHIKLVIASISICVTCKVETDPSAIISETCCSLLSLCSIFLSFFFLKKLVLSTELVPTSLL